MLRIRQPIGALAAGLAVLAGCQAGGNGDAAHRVPGGDPAEGVAVIREYGCGACHSIPGVDNASATVGPPLFSWARRTYIAGAIPNTPDNLIRWIMDPHAVEPGTAMPDVGVSRQQARDIAAYLFTLE